MMPFKTWRTRLSGLRDDVTVLAAALMHPKVPRYTKFGIALLLAYVISPIDFIPDFLPIIGWLDEFLLLMFVVPLIRWIIGPGLWAELQAEVAEVPQWLRTLGVILVLILWLLIAWLFIRWLMLRPKGV